MLKSFETIKDYVKISIHKVIIDDIVFKLHYKATFLILMVSTVLVTQRQFIGEHIKCISDAGVKLKVINTFCFFSSTFTVVKNFDESALIAGYLPHPGVGTFVEGEDDIVYHAYYQWVPFVLFIQAISFYIPHLIWKNKEGGRMKILSSGLQYAFTQSYEKDQGDETFVVLSESSINTKIDLLKLEFSKRLQVSKTWSYWLVFCEVLNLINLILQIYLTDLFLRGSFIGLGKEVWNNKNWNGYLDALDIIFPKVTKCTFYKYGPSGNIQNHDALCVMALNVIHEKIYSILWFWYLLLLIFTIGGLLGRLITFFMHSRSTKYNVMMFSYACPGGLNIKNMITITHDCFFGDWLFLYFLASNMNPFTFKLFFQSLAGELDEKKNVRSRRSRNFENNRNSRISYDDGNFT